jgi:hypothetical protein
LQGVISFQDEAIPIWGLAKSSSRILTARNMPRAAARSSPSVTSRLRGLRSGWLIRRSRVLISALHEACQNVRHTGFPKHLLLEETSVDEM